MTRDITDSALVGDRLFIYTADGVEQVKLPKAIRNAPERCSLFELGVRPGGSLRINDFRFTPPHLALAEELCEAAYGREVLGRFRRLYRSDRASHIFTKIALALLCPKDLRLRIENVTRQVAAEARRKNPAQTTTGKLVEAHNKRTVDHWADCTFRAFKKFETPVLGRATPADFSYAEASYAEERAFVDTFDNARGAAHARYVKAVDKANERRASAFAHARECAAERRQDADAQHERLCNGLMFAMLGTFSWDDVEPTNLLPLYYLLSGSERFP